MQRLVTIGNEVVDIEKLYNDHEKLKAEEITRKGLYDGIVLDFQKVSVKRNELRTENEKLQSVINTQKHNIEGYREQHNKLDACFIDNSNEINGLKIALSKEADRKTYLQSLVTLLREANNKQANIIGQGIDSESKAIIKNLKQYNADMLVTAVNQADIIMKYTIADRDGAVNHLTNKVASLRSSCQSRQRTIDQQSNKLIEADERISKLRRERDYYHNVCKKLDITLLKEGKEIKPIIGQEVICRSGLGRLLKSSRLLPDNKYEVKLYNDTLTCVCDIEDIILIDPRK